MIQQKLSLPLTCPILALIGLALGATNRKDGKLGSFVIGIGVIFIYYVLLWGARAAAIGGRFSPEWAPWIPNIVMGLGGLVMVAWRARVGDQPIRFSLPAFWRTEARSRLTTRPLSLQPQPRRGQSIRDFPTSTCRCRGCSTSTSRASTCGVLLHRARSACSALFYISTFIDLVDKLFRGETTGGDAARATSTSARRSSSTT